jgi:hypothetical protein
VEIFYYIQLQDIKSFIKIKYIFSLQTSKQLLYLHPNKKNIQWRYWGDTQAANEGRL